MFDDYSYSCGISWEVDHAAPTGNSVQSIRVTPIQGGAWCLPDLHPDIPLQINFGASDTDHVVAQFSLEANALGVPLPNGEFTSADHTLQSQWAQYIKAACGSDSPLNMSMHVQVTSKEIEVGIAPSGTLEVLRMRPLIEALNVALDGLGWWVYGVTCGASSNSYPIYGPTDYADFLERDMWIPEFTDKAVVDSYNDIESTELTRAEIQAASKPIWPSELITDFGGQTWMLGRESTVLTGSRKRKLRNARPKAATVRDAKRFLSDSSDPALKAAVASFLELHCELERPDSRMCFAEQGDRPMSDAWSDDDEDDGYLSEPETLGASCALVWEQSGNALSLIEANEVRLMESGEHVDDHIRFTSRSLEQSDLRELITSMKDFVRRHVAISKAFSHFEVINDPYTN